MHRHMDGATVTIAGRDFTAVDEPPDEDGHGWFGFACDTCGESGKTTWAEDHDCQVCPECGQTGEDARTEPGTYGYHIWRCCGQELRCPCGQVTNTVHRSVCNAWITP